MAASKAACPTATLEAAAMTHRDAATRMNTIESGNWCRVQAVTAVRQKNAVILTIN